MNILENKLLILSLVLNIIFIGIQARHYFVLTNIKQDIVCLLGKIGIDKYKQIDREYSMENLVIYFLKNKTIKILPFNGINNAILLNETSDLILLPNIYEWGGEKYDMRSEGYYSMIDFKNNTSRNFIIYNKDINALLSSLSWLHSHGNKDDVLSEKQKNKILKKNKLSLTCGEISVFVHNLLNSYNIENRLVTFLTTEEWNTYDNGHTLLEIKIDGKWILFDIDNNRYFEYKNSPMNIKSFLLKPNWNDIKYIMLSNDENLDTNGFNFKNISYHSVADYIYNNITKWYERVMQIPIIIEKDGSLNAVLINKNDKNKLLKYYPKINILTIDEFSQKYYEK